MIGKQAAYGLGALAWLVAGWGATIALYCDTIIARAGARIGDPHVNVGLSTGDVAAARSTRELDQ